MGYMTKGTLPKGETGDTIIVFHGLDGEPEIASWTGSVWRIGCDDLEPDGGWSWAFMPKESSTEGMQKVRIAVGVRPDGQYAAVNANNDGSDADAVALEVRQIAGPTARLSWVTAYVPKPTVDPEVTVVGRTD